MTRRLLPLAGLAVAAFVVLFFLAGCASDDPPPLTRQEAIEMGEAVRAFNAALCPAPARGGIPGGTLADGSCGE